MSTSQETLGVAKIDRGTQYEDTTLDSIRYNQIPQTGDKKTKVVQVREKTIGGADADKSTQCEDVSTSLACAFILDTIEEENTVTTDSISICSSEDPEDAEFRRQELFCASTYKELEPEGGNDNEKLDGLTADNEPCVHTLEDNNDSERPFFISRRENVAECEDRDIDLDVLGCEDDGCIIDKLDPIEELSEVDSLESFSTHECDVSRDPDLSCDSVKLVLEECVANSFETPCNLQRPDLSTGVPSEVVNKEIAPANVIGDSFDSGREESGDIAELSFIKGPIEETHLSVDNDSESISPVTICCKGETETSQDTLPFDFNENITMECESNAMTHFGETRLPPEGAKTEPEMNDVDADDTHSVDSLEMIETEKPPWKVIEETSQVPSPSAQEVNVAEKDDKNDCVSQSGSSVADSIDSDQAFVNGSRRSLSSTSDEGGVTPNKKESKLPIFIDKHPKFKGSNIPKPRTIRPQPAPVSPCSPDSNKETSNPSPTVSTTNVTNEPLNHDVTCVQKPVSATTSPKQRRKSSTGSDVIKEKVPKATRWTRQHTIDLGDMRPTTKEPSIEPRETLASRKRIAAIQNVNLLEHKENSDDYLTPFQRKEQTIKELKHELKETQKELAERDIQLQLFGVDKERDLGLLTKEKDDIIESSTKKYEHLLESFNDLQTSHEDVLRLANDLELKVHILKDEMTQREATHQEMYLEMYNKGMNSAKFERLDELEKIAKDEPDKVTVQELLEKLKTTETELGYWQSLKRHDIYAESEKPETEAAATLRFLKDSMFHYVTDPKESESHFRAMIQIFGYTPVQMKSIEKIMSGDKKPKKTLTKAKSVERKNSK